MGWTRSPPPTHAQIPSPPPNKVHRVQPGRRRHIKERFSGSIGSDYFQSVCCFRCVDSTNQTMVRIRSRVQPPPPQTRLTVVSSSRRNHISTFQRKKAQTSGFLFHSVVICSAQVQFISPLISSSLQIPSVLMFIHRQLQLCNFREMLAGCKQRAKI